MVKKSIDLTTFEKLFGNEKHPEIAIDFLNTLLGYSGIEKIKHIKLLSSGITFETDNNLLVSLNLNLEQTPFLREKALVALGELSKDDIDSKNGWSSVKRYISVNIIDFDGFSETQNFHSTFAFMELSTNQKMPDSDEIHFLDLTKLSLSSDSDVESKVKDDPLYSWALFLKDPGNPILREHATNRNLFNTTFNLINNE